MNGLGLIVVVSFVILTIAIFTSTCTDWYKSKECFADSEQVGGTPLTTDGKVANLPPAPITGLAENNSLPATDPVMEKSTTNMLKVLKGDMDGFASYEMPGLIEVGGSDPSVSLPLTRFKGDYRRVKDEILTVDSNPGLQPHLTIEDIQEMAANLRFLQRTYRTYSASNMVAPPVTGLSTVGEGFSDIPVPPARVVAPAVKNVEGFVSTVDAPISVDELNTLSLKLAVEIARLSASGSTDPVTQARVKHFTNIRQTVDDINTRIKNNTMAPADIPIKAKDYQKFLPALGSNSAGIAGILSQSGNSSLSSLFNSYDVGDISGSKIAASLFDTYANTLLQGMSYKLTLGYTSPNDVSKEQAIASSWLAKGGLPNVSDNYDLLHPGADGIRGGLDETFRNLDLAGSEGKVNGSPGSFDWKARADQITDNISRAGLNPGDYGCLAKGAQVSRDYSWRGHSKMICSRLATNADPGIPEQMGCPPVSWKGWKQ
jgi:hypothetical protein